MRALHNLLTAAGLVLAAGCATVAVPPPEAAAPGANAGALVLDGVPATPTALAQQLRPYQNMRPASFLGWLPDDSGMLVSLRFGNVPQLARISQPEGMRTQLTFFDEPIVQAWVSPDPVINGAIFSKDEGGNERFQLYFIDLKSGRARLLTDGSSRNQNAVFADDGRRFAYASTQRNTRDFDIWIGDVTSTTAHRRVLQPGGTWLPLDFSPDGSRLLVQEYISASDARLHVLDVESGTLSRVQIGKDPSFDAAARFDRGDGHVLVVTNALGEYASVVRVELQSGVVAPLFPQQQWDVEAIDLSRDERHLAVLRNVDGSSKLSVYDRDDGMQEIRTIDLDYGVIPRLQFNHAGTEIGFDIRGPQVPGDVFSRALNSGLMTRWTRGETAGIDPQLFVMPQAIRYGSFDGDQGMMNLPRQIPAYVYTPPGPGTYPVLIMIHGGPESQARPQFSELIQFLVREREIAVVVPNVRGSTGYGKTYLALDNGRRREDAVKDLGALIDYLATQPQFDANRIAVYGGSYGGYMVLASLVHFGNKLRAGVDIVGISNFVTFLDHTSPYRVDQRRREYGDEREPGMREYLQSISPLTHAERIATPLFVIQGANDPRVPRSEAEQILKAVRENERQAWYMLALDEGHGFRKKGNRDRMSEAVIQFLEQYLLPATPPP
jgi:dipeptidyl aminopeptidase/acylaminoacyl peptidase